MKTQPLELVPVYCQLSCAFLRAVCEEMEYDVRGVGKQSSSMDFFTLTPLLGFGRGKTMGCPDYNPPVLPALRKMTSILAFFVNQKALVFLLAWARSW